MSTSCRVWTMHQARCSLCQWSGEITDDAQSAARDARDHRRSDEHKNRVASRIHWRGE